jgi:hypothetical protein
VTQIIQHKRRIGGLAGAPTTLAAGELAYNNADQSLYVGADTAGTVVPLVNIARQLEIHGASPAQTIDAAAGAKTFPIAKLKVPGGNVGEALTISAVDGTLAYAPMVSASQQFVGSLDAAAGAVTFTTASGGAGPGLPAAGAGNNGWYVICDTAGATVPANVPPGTYNIGDWVISNGTAWTHLSFGGIETDMASEVGVAPAVAGGSNVQDALAGLEAAQANFVVGPAASVVDTIALYTDTTGLLIKQGPAVTSLATVAYVDAQDDAQDLIIAANAAFVAAQPAVDTAQDADIASKGDVFGPAAAVADRIASYADITGKVIKDGGILTTDLVVQTDLTGLGDVFGPNASTAGNIATYANVTGKLIADGGILATDLVVQADLAALGDVKGPATAVLDHIAVYADTTGKVIKNATKTIASIDAAIAAKGDVFGPAAAIVNNLAMFSTVGGKNIVDSTYSVQDFKDYVDAALAAIPGATPPEVTAPELTGDGSALAPITFTGITLHANVTGQMSGNGLSTNPLNLTVVDGGVF